MADTTKSPRTVGSKLKTCGDGIRVFRQAADPPYCAFYQLTRDKIYIGNAEGRTRAEARAKCERLLQRLKDTLP